MKKLCARLCGMLVCTTMINADEFSESDRELIGAKDFPFPPGQEPGQESSPDHAEDATDEEHSSSDNNRSIPQEEDS